MQNEIYCYEPLPPKYIRVLHLKPSKSSIGLSGDLVPISIDDESIRYDALSYVWGDATPVESIHLSDKAFPISANLASALHNLRHTKDILVIWVDAICINQQSLPERAQQVSMMRQIYQRAKLVRIWINAPSINPSDDAVLALQYYNKAGSDCIIGLGEEPDFWDPIAPIFENPYWSRVWIQQEVVNARRIQLHCASITIPQPSLLKFQQHIVQRRFIARRSTSETAQAWISHMMRLSPNESPAAQVKQYKGDTDSRSLLNLLDDCKYLNVTDERDRVYGVMHMADDYEDGGIEVDYKKGVVEVMIDAMDYHVRRHRSLEFLCKRHLERGENRARTRTNESYIPTWLPQWWSERRQNGFEINFDFDGMMHTQCSADVVLATERKLKIRGFKIDVVSNIFEFSPDLGSMTIKQFWNSSLGEYISTVSGTNMEALPQALYDILSTGYSREERPSYGATVSGLRALHDLSTDAQHADRTIGDLGEDILDLLDECDEDAQAGIQEMFQCLDDRMVILIGNKQAGLVPSCDIRAGDEVWIVLGCAVPLILRPAESGYLHVCSTYVPGLIDSGPLQQLKNNVDAGDSFGLWEVKDIELI